MHALPWGMAGCPAALHKLIQYWRAAGYEFVTVRTHDLCALVTWPHA